MRSQLISILTLCCFLSPTAQGHALFPGQQVVYTAGERAIAYFQTNHDGKETQEYRVEIFEYDRWIASRYAVASQERIAMAAYSSAPGAASSRRFSVMVDLGGLPERTIRVCTKSVPVSSLLQPSSTAVNTRICSKLVVRKM